MEMKICSRCDQEKPTSEFRWKNKANGIRGRYCIPCARASGKKHYNQNRNAVISQVQERNRKYFKINKEWKSRLHCVKCKEDEMRCLDFHHIDPHVKEIIISELMRTSTLKRMLKEVKKCVILCSNCHRKVHAGVLDISEQDIQESQTIVEQAMPL